MKLTTLVVIVLLTFGYVAAAQQACSSGGEEAYRNTEKLLKSASTCEKAAAIMKECAWGSSVDTSFSRIVLRKCEASFLKAMSAASKKRYMQEVKICWKEQELQSGTMSISSAAICQVEVATEYASLPSRRQEQPLWASFGCDKSTTVLERAICSDPELGMNDIILSRVYKRTAAALQRINYGPVLRDDERDWLQKLPKVCKVTEPFTVGTMDCLRTEFQVRFSLIESCSEEGPGIRDAYLFCLHDKSVLRGFENSITN